MKILIAAAVLAAAIASPAFAEMPGSQDKTDTKSLDQTNLGSYRVIEPAPGEAFGMAVDESGWQISRGRAVNGRNVGTDPDPFIRQELRSEGTNDFKD